MYLSGKYTTRREKSHIALTDNEDPDHLCICEV